MIYSKTFWFKIETFEFYFVYPKQNKTFSVLHSILNTFTYFAVPLILVKQQDSTEVNFW